MDSKTVNYPEQITKLPIFKHASRIKKELATADPLCIISPTGTGKTTFMIIERVKNSIVRKAKVTKGVTDFVGVPTIAATRSIEAFCGEMLPEEEQDLLGYACGGVTRYNDETRVAVCTHRHVYNRIVKLLQDVLVKKSVKKEESPLNEMFVMIDEAHEKSMENYMLITIVQFALSEGFTLKVVVSSATIDSAPQMDKFKNLTKVEVEGKHFPVEIKYVYASGDEPEDQKRVIQDAIELTKDLISQTKAGDAILVFCAGEKQIYQFCTALKNAEGAIVLPAHSSLPQDELDAIFEEYPDNVKVVIATNIAESAITIENVVHVVDLMRENAPAVKNGRILTLAEGYISMSSATQRKGRTGRTKAGTCWRMCSEMEYLRFRPYSVNEFGTMPKEIPIMELIDAGLPADRALQIRKEEFDKIIRDLTAKKLLEGGRVTKLGRAVIAYPVSVQSGIALHTAKMMKCKDCKQTMCSNCEASVILTVMAISMYEGMKGMSPFFYPRELRGKTNEIQLYRDETFADFRGEDDLETMLKIFLTMFYESKNLTEKEYRTWATQSDRPFNNRALSDARRQFRQLMMQFYPGKKFGEIDQFIFGKRLKKSLIFCNSHSQTLVDIDTDVMNNVRRHLRIAFPERFKFVCTQAKGFNLSNYYKLKPQTPADEKDPDFEPLVFTIHNRDSFCSMFRQPPSEVGALNLMEFEVSGRQMRSLSWTIKDPDLKKEKTIAPPKSPAAGLDLSLLDLDYSMDDF